MRPSLKISRVRSPDPARLLWWIALLVLSALMAWQLSSGIVRPTRFGLSPDAGLDELVTAVLLGDQSMVHKALKRTTDVNAFDCNGKTALCHDALNPNPDSAQIARLLIEHGADVNRPDSLGFTPLSKAVSCGNEPVVMVLLRAGADPNLRGNGSPCLHLATSRLESQDLLRLLLSYGADPNTVYAGCTALEYAREARNDTAVRILENNASTCARNGNSRFSH